MSLWDTLVVSTPAETPDLRERIRVTTGKFSRCLVKLTSPKVSLRHRATLPRWISPNLLVELEDEDKSENDPPPPTQQFRRSSQRISKVAGCEKAEVKKHQKVSSAFYSGNVLQQARTYLSIEFIIRVCSDYILILSLS